MRFTRLIIIAVLIAFLTVTIVPTQTQASVAINTAKCTLFSGLAKAIPQIIAAISLARAAKAAQLALTAIPGIGVFFAATMPESSIDYGAIAKNSFFSAFARCAARAVSDNFIYNIISVIQHGGPDGQSLVVQNWRNFITNSQYRGEMIFRLAATTTPVCDYLRKPLNDALHISSVFNIPIKGINLRVGDLNPYQLRARCTLPGGFDLAKYKIDFASQGGWAAFDRLLEPQNNIRGLTMLSQDELARQRNLEEQAALAEVTANNGYQSVRGPCQVPSPTGGCAVYGNIKTPGSAINAQYAAAAQSNFDWTTSVHDIQDLITQFLATQLSTQLNDLANGAFNESPDYNPANEVTPPMITLPATLPLPTSPVPSVPATTPTPTGGGTGAGDCTTLNPTDDPFGAAIKAAIQQIASAGGVLDINDSTGPFAFKILPGQADTYHAKMQTMLTTGTIKATWGGEELNMYQQGNATSDQYKIDFSNGYTTSKHKASGCPII